VLEQLIKLSTSCSGTAKQAIHKLCWSSLTSYPQAVLEQLNKLSTSCAGAVEQAIHKLCWSS